MNEVRNDGQLGNSDHNVLIIETNHRYMYCPDANVRLNYSRADYEKIRKLFKKYNWREGLCSDDINDCWVWFKNAYNEVVNKCIPTYQVKKKKSPLWMNSELLKLVRQKRKLWKKYSSDRSNENWNEFKMATKTLKKRIHKAKLNFEKMIAKNSKENPKAFYAYIGGKRSNRTGVGPLQNANGDMVVDDTIQAQLLNDYYGSVLRQKKPFPNPSLPTQPSTLVMPLSEGVY